MRTISGTPARPASAIPRACGRSAADSRRAARTTTHTRAAAEPTWASSVPMRGTGDAEPANPPDAVDEQQVEHDVREVARHRDHERGAGVLQPAQHAGRGEHQQHRDGAEQRDPQVGHGEVADRGPDGPNRSTSGSASGNGDGRDERADEGGQPEPGDALGQRVADLPAPTWRATAAVVP